MKRTIIILLSLIIFGCGGGSEPGSSLPPVNAGISPPPANESNPGGTVSSPSSVSFSKRNIISGDSFYNYFSLTLSEATRIHISVLLDDGLESSKKQLCKSGGRAYIFVNGSRAGCDHRFVMNFEAGEHEIHFDYPNQGNGYFNIDGIREGEVEILEADGTGGLPSSPKAILVGGDNKINENLLFNYYAYTGDAGDRIVINTYLEESIPLVMYQRCRSIGGGSSNLRGSAIGIRINAGVYGCKNNLDYVLPEAGTYYFHLFFMAPLDITFPVPGYFRVDIKKS
jgi:hypothetical protein